MISDERLDSVIGVLRSVWCRREFAGFWDGAVTVAAGLAAILLIASPGPAREARRTQPVPLLRED